MGIFTEPPMTDEEWKEYVDRINKRFESELKEHKQKVEAFKQFLNSIGNPQLVQTPREKQLKGENDGNDPQPEHVDQSDDLR